MAIPNMKEERLERLVTAYAEVLQEHRLTREILGIIGGDGSGWRWLKGGQGPSQNQEPKFSARIPFPFGNNEGICSG